MTCADRHRRAKEAWLAAVFNVAGDGEGACFVYPLENGGCERIYLRDMGAKKVGEMVRKMTDWLIDSPNVCAKDHKPSL